MYLFSLLIQYSILWYFQGQQGPNSFCGLWSSNKSAARLNKMLPSGLRIWNLCLDGQRNSARRSETSRIGSWGKIFSFLLLNRTNLMVADNLQAQINVMPYIIQKFWFIAILIGYHNLRKDRHAITMLMYQTFCFWNCGGVLLWLGPFVIWFLRWQVSTFPWWCIVTSVGITSWRRSTKIAHYSSHGRIWDGYIPVEVQ